MKKRRYFMLLALLLALFSVLPATAEVEFNATNFPDANFRKYLMDNYSSRGFTGLNVTITDANLAKMKYIGLPLGVDEVADTLETYTAESMTLKNVKSLRGIEYFPELEYLRCDYNSGLTSLDLSKNTKLKWLLCRYSGLTSLDMRKNTELTVFKCGGSASLASLNVSGLAKLEVFKCYECPNLPATLNLSTNTALVEVSAHGCSFKTIDLSNSTKLVSLVAGRNQLTTLKLPTTTTLTALRVQDNQLSSIDVSGYTNLDFLNIHTNKLPALDVSKNTKLTFLSCFNNQLTTLDVKKNTRLTQLYCHNNHLVELDLNKNTALTNLNYANQTRDITAEGAYVPSLDDKFYYLRLDDKVSGGGEKPIWGRMTETNYGGVECAFVPARVFGWTDGTVIEGKRNVAATDDINANNVTGTILVLEDVTEVGDVASGTVRYTYNVQNSLDPDGSKGDFTLTWTASANPEVVTDVPTLPAYREVVGVTYYNVAGMRSDRPFSGVNIIVTRYSDGSIETTKVLR